MYGPGPPLGEDIVLSFDSPTSATLYVAWDDFPCKILALFAALDFMKP